jgi:cation:H+ antiporter
MLDLVILAAGAALLYVGAGWLIAGGVGLGGIGGFSPLAIGLSVIAYLTVAPEFAVSLAAAHAGQSSLVLGTVVGANIANIGLVLGVTTLVSPPRVDGSLFRREVPYLLIATLAAGPVLLNGRIDRAEGALFVISAVVFTLVSHHWAKRAARVTAPVADAPLEPAKPRRWGWITYLLLLGAAALVGGGRLTVTGAIGIARDLGVDQRVIALSAVALGTSLPEIVTAARAARSGRSDFVVGHVLGANLFNLLFVLGLTTLVFPVEGKLPTVRVELVVMTLLTFALGMSVHKARTITRLEGALYLGSYVAFLTWLVSGS